MKWLLGIFMIFTFLIGGALIAPSFIDLNQYKGEILKQIETHTGLQAKIDGKLSVSLLPSPKAVIQSFLITDPQNNDQNLIQLEELNLHINTVYKIIQRGDLRVYNLSVEGGRDKYFRIRRDDLEAYLESRRVMSMQSS